MNNYQYNKPLKAAFSDEHKDGKVTAIFEDGTQATEDLLSGCDGSISCVREALLGPEKGSLQQLPLAYCALNGAVKDWDSDQQSNGALARGT